MKHIFNLAVAMLMLLPSVCEAKSTKSQPVTAWESLTLPVRTPFMNDSISPDGKKYEPIGLLKSNMPVRMKSGKSIETDTAGFVSFENAECTNIYVLQTNVRAPRFFKGKVEATSCQPFAILLDGKELKSKSSTDDSICASSKVSASVTLEPERDAVLSVRILSAANDSLVPTIKVQIVPDSDYDDITVLTAPDLKRRLKLTDTQYYNSVSGVNLSPDGKYLLLKETLNYDSKTWRANTRLIEVSSGRVLSSSVNTRARWMPNENILYYTVKTTEGYDLYNLDPISGVESLVTRSLPTDNFEWAPDCQSFFYTKVDEGVKESGPLRRYATPDDRMPTDRKRTYIMHYDLNTGLGEQITYGNHSTYLYDISPDGSHILVGTYCERPDIRPPYEQIVYQIDLNTMQADTLVPRSPQLLNGALYSPDGTKILFYGSPESFDGIGRNAGPFELANDYDTQMFVMDIVSREVDPVTIDFNPSCDRVLCWNKADDKIYFVAEEGFMRHIYTYDYAKRSFKQLPTEVDNVRYVSIPENSSAYIAYTGQSFNYVGRGYLLNTKKGTNQLLGDPNSVNSSEIELGEMQAWNFTARDGKLIEGYCCLPPGFDAEKKYPLIVYYYGGTSPSQASISSPYAPQLLASRDYVVYVLNPSGTTGYGQEFSARHVNAWGKYTADDIIEGVDKFVAAHPFVDSERIGCMGASYGGFMTQYLQTLTDKFAAAVSHAGISNVTSYWGEGYWGYSYNAVAAGNSYPWSNPDLYVKQGSLFNADKINTPLLLLHGTADTNVPIGESIQIFNALRILNKDVEFVSVDGENHFISDFEKRQMWQNTIMAWFAKYLQNDPRWWNHLYPERHL